ncbi:MAG: GNAT family N-acetyltransferase [Candidatus Thorarchaeota archaeon]
MKLQEYSQDDPKLKEYAEALEPYVGGYNARNVPYQVFIHKQDLVGFVVVSEEPVKLIEPLGTPMSNIIVIDYTKPVDVLKEFADGALRIARERNVAYSFIDIPAERSKFVDHFIEIGYTEIAYSLRMNRSLADYEGEPCNLRIVKAKREEVHDFIEKLKEFMSGSQDNMLNIIFDNIVGLPEQFIDHWFNSTNLNYVYDGDDLVGILDLSPQVLNIANIGVSPEHRRKGYGKQIMHYAFQTLKEQNTEFARLRVHAENEKAIYLYESFGMEKGRSFKALIWRK